MIPYLVSSLSLLSNEPWEEISLANDQSFWIPRDFSRILKSTYLWFVLVWPGEHLPIVLAFIKEAATRCFSANIKIESYGVLPPITLMTEGYLICL
jgi:hypothetical protein